MPTFTNYQTGRYGATQTWTVTTTGSYRITAKGARGGLAYLSDATTNPGGDGAIIQGDFNLTAGQVITMMVGQMGGDNPTSSRGGGGGGMTVVYNTTTSTLLMVAGGGGGAGQYTTTYKHAVTTANGQPGTSGTTPQSNGGTAPNGGGAGGSYAGGGAGYSGNGVDSGYGKGGLAYTNTPAGTGGVGYADGGDTTNFNGGYGGGGGAYAGAGGGGGYGGGGGGFWSNSGDGGGGGSYNSGTNQINSVGNRAHGSVVITANNTPPAAPQDLAVSEGMEAVYPAAANWTHVDSDGDPQSKYQLRWRAVI